MIVVVGLLANGWEPSSREPAATISPGNAGPAASAPEDNRPWTGVVWRRLVGAIPIGPAPGHDRFDGLHSSAGGLVAWGRTSTPGRNQFNDMGAIFLSATGELWQTVLLDAGVAPPDTSELHHVVGGSTGFVALGGVCCDVEERPALWISGDGRQWERVPYPEALFGAQINQLIATPTHSVAVGTGAEGQAAIWTSADGQEWNSVDPDQADFGPGGIYGVVATESGLLATGWRDTGITFDGAFWRSADAIEWAAAVMDPIFVGDLDTAIVSAVPFAGRWWAHGNEGPHTDRVECERLLGRIASIDNPTAPAAADPDLNCGWGVETSWVSDDGEAWERLPVRALGVRPPKGELIEFRFVSPGGPGLAVMGEGFEDSHPSPFVSDDGRAWVRLPSHPPFSIGQSIAGFAVVDRRLIVVGEDWNPNVQRPPVPAIWIGEVR